MSELNVWFDSVYSLHGVGGTQGGTVAGNWFLYDDCCVWARALESRMDRMVHDTVEKRVAAGEEQAKLSPQELVERDKNNWLVKRSDIRHGYMFAGKGQVNAGNVQLDRDVYFNGIVLELTDGSRKRLEWRFNSDRERDEGWPGGAQRWLGELLVEGFPPDSTVQAVKRLLRRS